jgi:hypothetical protein
MKLLVKLVYNKGQIVKWASSSMMIKITRVDKMFEKYLRIYGPTPPSPPTHVSSWHMQGHYLHLLLGTLQKLIKNETSYQRLQDG